MTLMPRDRAKQLGRETVEILKQGSYRTAGGRTVAIRDLVQRAVDGTQSYPPDASLPNVHSEVKATRIEVENETTLVVGRRLVDQGQRVVALNFASAKHPGGGFLSGARAQEESLARSSGLYACLVDQPMYDYHRALGDAMYTNYAIYSPDVPILRTDDGTLLDTPWLCSFITSPAVNAKIALQQDASRGSEIRDAMRERIRKVLAIAAVHGHDTLVLGAWGCGAFGNDGQDIAALFHEALTGSFNGMFEHVVFAITDWSSDRQFIGPFQRVFDSSRDAC